MSLLKIFLIIYAASAIFTSVTQEIFMIIALKRIKKELNKFAPGSQIIFFKDFKSILENILKTLFISIIPIFNMVYPWIIIFNFEKIYPNVKKDYINDKIFFGGEENENIKDELEEKIDYKTMTPEEMIAYLEEEKQKFLKFQELYGNDKIGETLDVINEQTKAKESKPKTYSLGNNSNLKHK